MSTLSAVGCWNVNARDSSPMVSPRSIRIDPSSSALVLKSLAVVVAAASSAVVMRIESITQHTKGSPPLVNERM